mgnify:CR=1 FL=1|tara:strand:- start:396 stop:587 length:192 start_codon:yes stop_codon:yes gene_type:complete
MFKPTRTFSEAGDILQYKSGKVYTIDSAARVILEKTVDGKKWIRKQFKNRQEMLKYKTAKRLQ